MKSFRAELETGKPHLGCFVTYPSPGAVERIGPDWDWLWIDGQHGQMGYNDLISLVRACDLVGRPSLVRVPSHERGPIALALDMAATGVIVPQVNDAAEAAAAVRAAKFPPLGDRSYGGRRPVDLAGRDYSASANSETLLAVQIESRQAMERIDEIAAVEGVDVLNLGPDDIYLRLGWQMDQPKPKDELVKDLETLVRACREHGRFSMAIGIGAEMIAACVSLGVNMIVCASDVGLLAGASGQAAAEARAIVSGRTGTGGPGEGSVY